ncbi:hypothetical protein [Paucisalibacillus sp. EB02]|uniref:hypothetical protein n=1 Tax=Paucisalibacillus sp. EB02 TaxID=1347087 RepID=UPI0004B793D9|nr:hypothetical protein [Paucisalibacillus sp. EB02]
MRKVYKFVVLFSIPILLIACSVDKDADLDSAFKGTQKIDIFLSHNKEVLTTISDERDIADFVKELRLDDWKIEKASADATVEKQFKLYQTETVKIGKSSSDKKELKEVGKFITYQDIPYVDLHIKNIKLSFKVPEEVGAYLSNYK